MSRVWPTACLLLVLASGVIAQPPTATLDVQASPFTLRPGAWAWTGSLVVQVRSDGGDAVVTTFDPITRETKEVDRVVVAQHSWIVGQAAFAAGRVVVLANGRTVCPSDYCVEEDLPIIVSYDPATSKASVLEVDLPTSLRDRVAVAAGDDVYLVRFGPLGQGSGPHVVHYDAQAGTFAALDWTLPFPVLRAGAWTGEDLVFFAHNVFATGSAFLAIDASDGSMRPFGPHGFTIASGVPALAWDGDEVVALGGRVDSSSSPANIVIAISPEDGALREVARVLGAGLGSGLLAIGDRLAVLGVAATCFTPAGMTWVDEEPPRKTGVPPTVVATGRVKAYHADLDHGPAPRPFYIEVDACGSSDPDGTIVGYEVRTAQVWTLPASTAQGRTLPASGEWFARGDHTFLVTVWDDAGLSANTTLVVHVEGNAPQAAFDARVDGLTVHVDGSPSADAGGQVVAWHWDWGDGETTSGRLPDGTLAPPRPVMSHSYAVPGSYNVTLFIEDDEAQRANAMHVVTVGAARDDGAAEGAPGSTAVTCALVLLGAALCSRRRR